MAKANKDEIAAKKTELANAFRATLGPVRERERELAEAHKAQTPVIAALVEMCGNKVKMKIDGKETIVTFRKAGDGFSVTYDRDDQVAI